MFWNPRDVLVVLQTFVGIRHTPPKMNMESEDHCFEKENHLPNLHSGVPYSFSPVYPSVITAEVLFFIGLETRSMLRVLGPHINTHLHTCLLEE